MPQQAFIAFIEPCGLRAFSTWEGAYQTRVRELQKRYVQRYVQQKSIHVRISLQKNRVHNWYLHVVGSTNLSYPPKRSNWKMPILHSIEAKRSFANDRANFGSSSIATNVRDAASPQPPAVQVVSMIIACTPLQGLL